MEIWRVEEELAGGVGEINALPVLLLSTDRAAMTFFFPEV
jgi:hypothetical protein